MDAKRHATRHIIIKMPKDKDKQRILKAEREKKLVRGVPTRLSTDFSKKNFACQKGLARNIQSHEKQGPTAKIALPRKVIDLESKGR